MNYMLVSNLFEFHNKITTSTISFLKETKSKKSLIPSQYKIQSFYFYSNKDINSI